MPRRGPKCKLGYHRVFNLILWVLEFISICNLTRFCHTDPLTGGMMVGLRFADMRLRPTEFLDFTSLTVEEFQMLIPPFEAAFQAHMAVWCLDGTARPPVFRLSHLP